MTQTDAAGLLDGYDAVVYDLDGTLVHLDVDWDDVAADAVDVFAAHGVDAAAYDLWAMLDLADEHGMRGPLEDVIAEHERTGAERSKRLPLADRVATHAVPVGVCSLNCEASVDVALETHGLTSSVGAAVGRDTVATRKPDPEPLLETLRRLDAAPENAVFVGDSPRDRETAEKAGVAYVSVASF